MNNNRLINDQEQVSAKKVIIILLIILAVFGCFYFITTAVLKNKTEKEEIQQSVIQTDKIMFGQLLNRKEAEYYVLAAHENTKYQNLYSTYLKKYKEKENSLKVYAINLDEGFNKSFVAKEENIVDDVKEIKVKDDTLFKIKDGKITEHQTGFDNITKTLKGISE